MSEKRVPWGKWYWGDWRKDARLRRCTYAVRGLWIDMLSLMGGECDHYGYLIMEGQALGAADLAALLGGSEREVGRMLDELYSKRVYSKVGDADIPEDVASLLDPNVPRGTIINRRMVRDKAKEVRDRENGKGGGNPNLINNDKPGHKGRVNPPDKAQKLEARTQKLEENQIPNTESDGAPAPADYAFSGKLIRINRADYASFKRQFRNLNGHLEAEFAKADAYYVDHPPKDGKWWFQLTKWLDRANREAPEIGAEDSW